MPRSSRVGAALTARDAVVEAATPYVAGRDSAERELEKVGKRVQVSLKRFERRGSTARNRALREVKRTRTRVERELRQRRNSAVRTVKQNRREAERQVKSRRQPGRASEVQTRSSNAASPAVRSARHRPGASAADFPRPVERPDPGRGCRRNSPVGAVSLLPHQRRPFGGGVGLGLCLTGTDADPRTDRGRAPWSDRSRAPQGHRDARDGALDRAARRRARSTWSSR